MLPGRAYESNATLPYQAIVAALRGQLSLEPDLQSLLSRTWWAELSRLLSEVADAVADLPRPLALGETEGRARLF